MVTSIRIRRKSNTEESFPEMTEENYGGELQLDAVSLLEKGMTSGKTSVGMSLLGEDGKRYLVQMSLEQFNLVVSAARGAEQNWAENPEP